MYSITARNVNDALVQGLQALFVHGVKRESRNGPVLVFPTPVTTQYQQPTERVLFSPLRDANPFFHLFEALWMLAGRNDVAYPAHFVDRMRTYSDDGTSMHGAYGHRWRHAFGFDQLKVVERLLREDPDCRRAVLSMWDPPRDLGKTSRDLPCNLNAKFYVDLEDRLSMIVHCRSNDALWGAYGANAVHFSVLQEYLARRLDREVGRYWQVSDDFHVYLSQEEKCRRLAEELGENPYEHVRPRHLLHVADLWDEDLSAFMQGIQLGLRDSFFRRVAVPMWQAHAAYTDQSQPKQARIAAAYQELARGESCDWIFAAEEWLRRREEKHAVHPE